MHGKTSIICSGSNVEAKEVSFIEEESRIMFRRSLKMCHGEASGETGSWVLNYAYIGGVNSIVL